MVDQSFVPLIQLDPCSGEYFSFIRGLQDNDIAYRTQDRTVLRGRSLHSLVEILVTPADCMRANTLLREVDASLIDATPSFCPRCDGEQISPRIRPFFMGIFQRKVFRCEDCAHEWRPVDRY